MSIQTSSGVKHTPSLYLGFTTQGVPQPVFFDPHAAAFNDRAPGTVITGGPGSGKTYTSLTLGAMSRIMGKNTIVLDAKGDMLQLASLYEEIGIPRIWSLASPDRRFHGILDPFYLADDRATRLSLVISLLEIFLDGIDGEEMVELEPIVKDVLNEDRPSLLRVVDMLRGSESQAARNMGSKLNLIKDLQFAKLCFSTGSKTREPLSLDNGLTIISMANLPLPHDGNAKTNNERLAMGVFFLVLDYIKRRVLGQRNEIPVTLIIDEAHIPVANQKGADTIEQMCLLGRSYNLAIIMATQNTSHLSRLNIENTITTRFAFRTGQGEARAIRQELNLPAERFFEDLLQNLERGECVMKDWQGKYATVKISDHRKHWSEAFNTNPEEFAKRQLLARRKSQADKLLQAQTAEAAQTNNAATTETH